jgi:virginiamycin B lyase
VSGPPGAGSGITAPCARSTRPRMSPARCLLFLVGLLASLALPASAAAIDEFPVPNGGNPGGITAGPDGALWFTQETSGEIGRMTTTGAVTEFPVTSPTTGVAALDQIVAGPDGRLWFTMPRDHAIGAITTAGGFTPYLLPATVQPEGITVGPDGNLWFTDFFNQVGRITPGGVANLYVATGPGPSDITTGPDGALWFTEAGGNSIGRATTGGAPLPGIPVPTPGSEPTGITYVPGSGLWFTESGANQIGHIPLSGGIVEYPGTAPGPSAIAAGRDGALWFTEFLGNKIGRIDTAPPPPPPPPVPPPRIPITVPTVTKKPVCKVPKVKRLSVAKAKKKLKKARCKFRVRGRGFVMSTKPKAGKRTTKTVVVKAKPKKAKPGGRSS